LESTIAPKKDEEDFRMVKPWLSAADEESAFGGEFWAWNKNELHNKRQRKQKK